MIRMKDREMALMIIEKYREIIPEYHHFVETIFRDTTRVVRINRIRASTSYIKGRLKDLNIEARELPWYRDALLVFSGKEKLAKTLDYHLGLYYIMDLTSLIPPLILRKYLGDISLDIAAAPGGKALMIAEFSHGRGIVIANEPDSNRYKALISNIDRMGYSNIFVTKLDGRRFPKVEGVGTVLFDAPCSSEIHIKRISEIRDYLNGNIYKRYSRLQIAILYRLYEILTPGSIVLYSVCTFNPLEAEYVVMKALETGYEVLSVPSIPLKFTSGIESWNGIEFPPDIEKTIRVYPHLNTEYGNPGYLYIALLRR